MMINNQDAVCAINEGNVFVAVLADGAGSHCYSDLGASAVSATVCSYLMNNIERLFTENAGTIKSEIISETKSILNAVAVKHKCASVRDLGSTLIFAASDGVNFITGHLGDGIIAGISNSKLSVISFPENGNNGASTVLTTSCFALEKLRITRRPLESYDELILMTDGLTPLVFNQGYILNQNNEIGCILDNAVENEHPDDASYIKIRIERSFENEQTINK